MMTSGVSQGACALGAASCAGAVTSASLLGPFFWPPCPQQVVAEEFSAGGDGPVLADLTFFCFLALDTVLVPLR